LKNLVVVTGASGFVGKSLLSKLATSDFEGSPLARDSDATETGEFANTSPYGASGKLAEKLSGAHAIVHLGARAHVMNDRAIDVSREFRKANTETSLQLATLAAGTGIKRFVFVSSIGVNGSTTSAVPFNEESHPNPVEPYAISKFEAEQGLREIAARTGMEIVIVRPPLVYGPNCPGNFLRLLNLVYSGVPLPIGAVSNLRSLIGVSNLADFLLTCVEHPAAANKTFLIADNPDISTPDLIRILAEGMGRPSRLLPVPYSLTRGVAGLFGKRAALDKLCGTLQIDSSFARTTLGWNGAVPLKEGLLETARWYAQLRKNK
jgi:nucleoside-diphosphate-sugar epimerase